MNSAKRSISTRTLEFAVVGSRKCATTWLYELFQKHKDICVSNKVKQSGYFTKYHHRGERWYLNLFSNYKHGQLIGEVDPEIISTPGSLEKLCKFAPKAKIIAIFRNPADLFFSSYEHAYRKGDLRCSPEEAWEKYPRFYEELKFGTMAESLNKLFQPERVLILRYEELEAYPEKVLLQLSSFLDVSNSFNTSQIKKRVNPTRLSRHPNFTRLLTKMARFCRKHDLHFLVSYPKKFLSRLEIVMDREDVLSNRNSDLRTIILNSIKSEIDKFQSLSGIDVQEWKSENQ